MVSSASGAARWFDGGFGENRLIALVRTALRQSVHREALDAAPDDSNE
jgi:hypothetical protein